MLIIWSTQIFTFAIFNYFNINCLITFYSLTAFYRKTQLLLPDPFSHSLTSGSSNGAEVHKQVQTGFKRFPVGSAAATLDRYSSEMALTEIGNFSRPYRAELSLKSATDFRLSSVVQQRQRNKSLKHYLKKWPTEVYDFAL